MYHKITATKLRVLINSENCIELDILFETLFYFYVTYWFYREKRYY